MISSALQLGKLVLENIYNWKWLSSHWNTHEFDLFFLKKKWFSVSLLVDKFHFEIFLSWNFILVEVYSFSCIHRLVIDRETGKPKGYGFCEYKDEETALSARRNLQGYEINGRQLRVDFAENDKGNDRNREQVYCQNFLK